jgi:hypothetical protein
MSSDDPYRLEFARQFSSEYDAYLIESVLARYVTIIENIDAVQEEDRPYVVAARQTVDELPLEKEEHPLLLGMRIQVDERVPKGRLYVINPVAIREAIERGIDVSFTLGGETSESS